MSKPIPWRAGQVAAMMIAMCGPEAFERWNAQLPPRLRSEPEAPKVPDVAAMSAAEEKRARKAAKRLKELPRG